MKRLSNKLERLIEKQDWNITYYDESNSIEFQRYSNAGRDFSFMVDYNGTLSDLMDDITTYYENFDIDEETIIWIGEDGHGKNGAPYRMVDVLRDTIDIEYSIIDLIDVFGKYLANKNGKKYYSMYAKDLPF